jgi:hypothetical protein
MGGGAVSVAVIGLMASIRPPTPAVSGTPSAGTGSGPAAGVDDDPGG